MTNATSVESGGVRGDDRAGTSVAILPATQDKPRHRCRLCPLCRCHRDCHGVELVEAVDR